MRVQLAVNRPRHDDGAVAILVAVMAVVLFGMAAFVVDFGMGYTNKRQLQTAADSSVLAAAREVHEKADPSADCATIDGSAVEDDARAEAVAYLGDNADSLSGTSTGEQFSLTCEGGSAIVYATTGRTTPTLIAGLLGVDEITVSREARATVGPAGSVIGVRPFGICEDLVPPPETLPSAPVFVPVDNADFGCGMASGNWAMMDLNGGANSSAEAKSWILDGYADPVDLPTADGLWIDGDTGLPSPGGFSSAMNAMMGIETVLPVFSEIASPSGSNADFKIVRFVGVTLCGWKFNAQSGAVACYDPTVGAVPDDYIQVKFTDVVAVGDLSTWCVLGEDCDTGVRVVKLID